MSDHLSPHERALLDALQRADTPDIGEQRRVKQRVFTELGLGAVGITAATVASQVSHAAPASGIAIKAATTGAAQGVAQGSTGVATTSALGASATGAATSGGFAAALLAKVGTTKLVLGLTAALTTAGGTAAWWTHVQEATSTSVATPTVAATSVQHANPEPAVADLPVASELIEAPRKASTRRLRSMDSSPAAERAAPKSSLEEEAQLLATAQQRISQGDASGALSVLAAHQKQFPRGALSLERQATVAIAHCLSGQTSRGRGEAERFRRKHPNSPMVKRLESACKLESP